MYKAQIAVQFVKNYIFYTYFILKLEWEGWSKL